MEWIETQLTLFFFFANFQTSGIIVKVSLFYLHCIMYALKTVKRFTIDIRNRFVRNHYVLFTSHYTLREMFETFHFNKFS